MRVSEEVVVRPVKLALVALVSATITEIVADVGFAWALNSHLVVSYLVLCAFLALCLTLVVGAGAAVVRAPAWLALAVYVGVVAATVHGPIPGVTWLVAAAAVLALRAHQLGPVTEVKGAIALGSGVGLALSAAVILWPRVLFGREFFPDPIAVGGALAMAAVLTGTLVWARIRQAWHRVPSELALVLAGVVVLFLITPSFMTVRRVDLPESPGLPEHQGLPHVLILVLDTVRADHLSLYGYPRDTTPVLARWVAENDDVVVYPMALSTSPWTAPAHASLFSGLPVSQHGVHQHGRSAQHAYHFGYLPSSATLAEAMQAAGYRTAGIFANLHVLRVGGFERGLEVAYVPRMGRRLQLVGEVLRGRFLPDLLAEAIKPYPGSDAVNAGILRFLDQCIPSPCFATANYMDAHIPLHPRPPHEGLFSDSPPPPGAAWDDEVRELAADYDESIRGLDERLGELLAALDDRGILEQTWIFITSDHGEAFAEHDLQISHGTSVYNEQVLIPLIVKPPRGVRLERRDDAVGLLDVSATVSAIAGQPTVGLGRDLRDPSAPEVPQFIDLYSRDVGEHRAVVYGGAKLIQSEREITALYDLEADPGETENRLASDPERASQLQRLWTDSVAIDPGETPGRLLSVDEADTLRALGYLD